MLKYLTKPWLVTYKHSVSNNILLLNGNKLRGIDNHLYLRMLKYVYFSMQKFSQKMRSVEILQRKYNKLITNMNKSIYLSSFSGKLCLPAVVTLSTTHIPDEYIVLIYDSS